MKVFGLVCKKHEFADKSLHSAEAFLMIAGVNIPTQTQYISVLAPACIPKTAFLAH